MWSTMQTTGETACISLRARSTTYWSSTACCRRWTGCRSSRRPAPRGWRRPSCSSPPWAVSTTGSRGWRPAAFWKSLVSW